MRVLMNIKVIFWRFVLTYQKNARIKISIEFIPCFSFVVFSCKYVKSHAFITNGKYSMHFGVIFRVYIFNNLT